MLTTIILLIIVLALLFLKFFLRDPERNVPKQGIVAPADGRVIKIMEISEENLKIKKGIAMIQTLNNINAHYLISIFMSPFDVHVNRAPIDGNVMTIKHKPGKFFAAYDFEKSLENESNEIILETKIGKIKIIQIAGFLARRIQCFVKPNQKINKGDKIGRIIIGSQVTLLVPKVELNVKVGDHVKAGETIIAK